MPELSALSGRQQSRCFDAGSYPAADGSRDQAVTVHPFSIQKIEAVTSIAGEQFIAAFAGQDTTFTSCAAKMRYEVQGDAGGPGNRLVFVPDEIRKRVEEVIHADDDFVMFRSDALGDRSRIRESLYSASL